MAWVLWRHLAAKRVLLIGNINVRWINKKQLCQSNVNFAALRTGSSIHYEFNSTIKLSTNEANHEQVSFIICSVRASYVIETVTKLHFDIFRFLILCFLCGILVLYAVHWASCLSNYFILSFVLLWFWLSCGLIQCL